MNFPGPKEICYGLNGVQKSMFQSLLLVPIDVISFENVVIVDLIS